MDSELLRKKKNAEYMRKWRNDNIDKDLQSKKTYRESHKEEIKTYTQMKHECDCGGFYTMTHKKRHFGTKKHQNFLKE